MITTVFSRGKPMDGPALDARGGRRVKTVVFGTPRLFPLLRDREIPLAVTAAPVVGQTYFYHYL